MTYSIPHEKAELEVVNKGMCRQVLFQYWEEMPSND